MDYTPNERGGKRLSAAPFALRAAHPGEVGAVNALYLEMLRTIYPDGNHTGYSPGDLDRYFDGGEDRLFVAEAGENLVAFLALEVHREDMVFTYVDDFSVTKDFRGRGIGHALLAEAEEYTRAVGISAISLHVEKHNTGARRLYERLGYTLYADQGTRLLLVKAVG